MGCAGKNTEYNEFNKNPNYPYLSHASSSSAPSPSHSTSNEPHEVSFSTVGQEDVTDVNEPTAKESWKKMFTAPLTVAVKKKELYPYYLPGQSFPIPGKFYHEGFSYTKKNVNNKEVQFKCTHGRAKKFGCCSANLYLPLTPCKTRVINRPRLVNKHTLHCCKENGVDTGQGGYEWDGKVAESKLLKLAKEDVSPSKKLKLNESGELFQPNIDASIEMKLLTKDLALKHLCLPPKKIMEQVMNAMTEKYPNNFIPMAEKSMMQLVKSTRTAMDQGNNISTIEKAYLMMSDMKKAFLHFNASFPHPNEPKKQMQMMIFSNPTLIGLLKGLSIDIFIDATFRCCLHPFEQCLIIMVHDHHTSAYVPVLYILMTNKFESQY